MYSHYKSTLDYQLWLSVRWMRVGAVSGPMLAGSED